MRLGWTRVRRFVARPVARAWRGAAPDARPVAVAEALLLAVAFEARDRGRPEVLTAAAGWAAATWAPRRPAAVVLHSFHFLTPEPLAAREAADLYTGLAAALGGALGVPVRSTAYGWRHALELEEEPDGTKGVVDF
ncbi:MAG: hypothetical protein K6V97_07080 [Actinomycetia bacterium]|nr:hypothetical protein [Actinomycetes bacterium]